MAEESYLTAEDIQAGVSKRLEKYDKLNFLEKFSMFMGVAQILEIGLKNLLAEKYNYETESMEKWTLGKTKSELASNHLRPDFIRLLESVVEYRNYIAHDLLGNEAIIHGLIEDYGGRFEQRQLEKGIYELEQLVFLFDWCQQHDGWG